MFSRASEVTVQEVKRVSKTELETFVDVTEKTCTKVIMKHSIGFAHHRNHFEYNNNEGSQENFFPGRRTNMTTQ